MENKTIIHINKDEIGKGWSLRAIEDDERQVMLSAGVEEQNIFVDKVAGKDSERKEYNKMLESLQPGDVVFIRNLDSLGDSYDDIIEQWKVITKEKQADIVVLDAPMLDTRKGKEIIGSFLSDVLLATLSAVSIVEKKKHTATIVKVTNAIAKAQKRGVRFGRPEVPVPDNFDEIVASWKDGRLSAREAAKMTGLTEGTFYT